MSLFVNVQISFFYPDTLQEPYPTFDIEINKEDKDKEVDNPNIEKMPENGKTNNENSPESGK